MIDSIREETIRILFTIQVDSEKDAPKRERVLDPGEMDAGGDDSIRQTPRRNTEKVGRNDPCPCGSGKKYKKCHGLNLK
jgi:preprotein translocase subunit SecA